MATQSNLDLLKKYGIASEEPATTRLDLLNEYGIAIEEPPTTPSITNTTEAEGKRNQETASNYYTNSSSNDGLLDNVLASGRFLRAGLITALEGQGLKATADNAKAAWASADANVKTSFMEAINDSMDKIRLAEEGTYPPIVEKFAKDPTLSAAFTTAFGLTGDILFEPLNLLGGAGVIIGKSKTAQKAIYSMKARKADKIINKANTRAEELMAKNPQLGREQALERALLEKEVYRPLLIEMRGVTPDNAGMALKAQGTFKPYVPRESKNIVGKLTDDFFSGINRVGDVLTKPISVIDDGVRPILTRISEKNPAIGAKLMEFEYKLNTNLHKDIKVVEPFIKKFNKLKDPVKVELSKHLYNRNFEAANNIFKQVDGMKEDFYTAVKPLLDDSYARMRATNADVEFLPQYFPRYIEPSKRKDFLKKMDIMDDDGLQRSIYNELTKKGRTLSPTEYADVVNKSIRSPSVETVIRKISPEKTRAIDELGDDLMEFYGTADKALLSHIRDVNHAVARRNFLGKYADDIEGNTAAIEDSIGMMVQQEKAAGRLTYDEANEIKDLLLSRFVGGEKSMNNMLAGAKGIAYMTTIANPYSAITQLGDLGTASYVLNPINAARGAVKAITRSGKVSIDEYGLDLMGELSDVSKNAKWLNRMFSASGFRTIDRLGKQTIIDGSFAKWSTAGTNPKRAAQLRARFQPLYGKERTDQLIKDFAKYKNGGVVTDDMKFVTFADLLDIQPVVMSSMPKAYLNNPNARIAWQLKTFMLKQMDLVRSTAIKNIKQGKVLEGAADLARYGILVGGANTGSAVLKEGLKGWISGEDRLEEYLDKHDNNLGMLVAANLFKTFGYSSYLGDRFKAGQLDEVANGFIAPPSITIPLDIAGAGVASVVDEDIEPIIDMLRYTPVFGNELKQFLSD